MEHIKPPWLDDTFLTKVLQSVEETREGIQVTSCGCEAAVAPGTNYLSSLYRLHVEYKVGDAGDVSSVSLIVKTPLEEHGCFKDYIESTGGSRKEVMFYNEILPVMKTLTSGYTFTPQSFACPLDNSLVLEDLRASGYKMADRLKRLNLEHCRHTLTTLARFHASSVAVFQNKPDLIDSCGRFYYFDDRVSEKERADRRAGSDNQLRMMMQTVEELEGCERFVEMLRERTKTSWEKVSKLYRPRKLLNVLIHGDCWTNNILFKYDENGRIIDSKLLDFQMLGFGSFAIDLFVFWWTSANDDVTDHREELFEEYRQTLNSTLAELKCTESITKEDFECEIKSFAVCSLYVMSLILPYAMADPEAHRFHQSESLGKRQSKDEPSNSIYFKGKYYKTVLSCLLYQAEKLGAFTD